MGLAWIITTLRNLTYEDYNTWQKGIENDYEDCELLILVYLFEGEYSYIKILPSWKDEERITPAIKIPYLSWNKRLLMSEFIEPFLVALSQFLTEEERGKLPPPWSEREEEEKKKGKRKRKKDDQSDDGRISVRFVGEIDPRRKKDDQSDDGRISVRFVGEIDPRDYFGLWNEDNDKHKE